MAAPRSSSSSRKPVPSIIPPMPSSSSSDELSPTEHTINFHRRPSTTPEPVTTRHRSLVSPSPSPSSPAPASPEIQHTRRQSHARTSSISLSPESVQHSAIPLPSPPPPLPSPTRTRAPLESFASVEMLQGQRNHELKRRGSEVWGSETGRYEGRGTVGPNEIMKAGRQSQRWDAGEVDLGRIASQLRREDERRGSADDPSTSWRRPSITPPAPPTNILMPSLAYSFPARPTISQPYVLDAESSSSNSDDGYDLGVDESPPYNPFSTSTEKLSPGSSSSKPPSWRTEILEGNAVSASYGASHRPSIVALPVYPAPSGKLAKSWKFKRNLRAFGVAASWFTLAASLGAHWAYLVKRSEGMAAVEADIPGRFWVGWVMLAVEFLIAVIVGIQAIWDVVTYRSTSTAPKLRLRGDKNLPSVDVLIIASGQPDQITFDCAIAAASMDYAAHRFRVMVIDPTSSSSLARDIASHAKSQGCPHLSYHARSLSADEPVHSRAGSVNFGLKQAASFGIKGPGEFVVVFEADVIPERNFLRAALPAVLSDPKVALVKTGHGFINLPTRLSQATSTLIEASEPKSDSRSGFILRLSSLHSIGGLPAHSWLPDGHAEALLRGKGYEVVETDEVLQWGMARPTYGVQVNQMMVNRLAPLRTAVRLGFYLGGGEALRRMTIGAKIRALWRSLQPIFSLAVLFLTVAYPLMFTYGGLLILTPNLSSLNDLLLSTLIMLLTASLHDLLWTYSTSLPSPRRKLQAWVFSAPYEAVALLRLILPSWLGGYAPRGSDMDLTSVAPPERPSFWKRLGWLVIDPHSDVIFAFAGSIGVVVGRAVKEHFKSGVDVHQTALTILLTVAWPSLVWVDLIYGSLVPYTCLMFPSHLLTARRDIFVIRDSYSSIARPKHAFKTARPFKVNRWPQVATAVVTIGWAIAAVAVGRATDVFK